MLLPYDPFTVRSPYTGEGPIFVEAVTNRLGPHAGVGDSHELSPEDLKVLLRKQGIHSLHDVGTAILEHLVRRGHIVIYPRYMEVETPVPEYLPNATAAIGTAPPVSPLS